MSRPFLMLLALPLIYVVAVTGIVVMVRHHEAHGREVTVCHSKYESNCLWIDGHAEWH